MVPDGIDGHRRMREQVNRVGVEEEIKGEHVTEGTDSCVTCHSSGSFTPPVPEYLDR